MINDHTVYVHGTVVPLSNNAGDEVETLVVNEQDVKTGESKLAVYRDPERPVWITKPHKRTYRDAREYEEMANLDMYMCQQSRLNETIFSALYGYEPSGYVGVKTMLNNPYVFGADIPIDVLYKRNYKRACDERPRLNIGSLDIETDVVNHDVICISYLDMRTRTLYTSVLKSKMKDNKLQEILDCGDREFKAISKQLNDTAKAIYDAGKLNYVVEVLDKEVDVIIWTFKHLHKCKPDFCVIWNMGYDIPYLVKRLEFRNILPHQVFCHPDVPKDVRYFEWVEDKSKRISHITDYWHQCLCPGYTKFIDAMALFAVLRIAKGKEITYRLDYIASRILGIGKMEIKPGATHAILQDQYFVQYCVYNGIDVVLLWLMEECNHDVSTMLDLLGISEINSMRRQTVQIRNAFFDYGLNKRFVSKSVRGDQTLETDRFLGKFGGGVLSPNDVKEAGTNILAGAEHLLTKLCKLVCDLDVAKQHTGDRNCKVA